MTDEGLRIGMFLGGLLMAMVPISLTVGVGVFVLRRALRERRQQEAGPDSPTPGGISWP